ncbi:hypothetical protein GJS40_04400 [Aliibacillus thermotolerans]|nr:hypothetical protein [Aliibacillus thermotolerans]
MEHTIFNVTNMSFHLQQAESRIRDVDTAKEMGSSEYIVELLF